MDEKTIGSKASSANKVKAAERSRRAKRLLWGSILVTVVLYQLPFARWLVLPLIWFSTLVHEMGHGVAGMMVGGELQYFKMYWDGSGVAYVSGSFQPWEAAFRSAGGLCGPAVLAALGFTWARRPFTSKVFLWFFVSALVVAEILVVRNLFSLIYVGFLVALLGWAGLRKKSPLQQNVVVFLCVQLALSVFSRGDYLFTDVAKTGAGEMPSDVANMASQLGGPFWFWGALCGLFSIVILWLGVRLYLKGVPLPDLGISGLKK